MEDAVSVYATEVQTYAEELLNTITHAMGLMLSIPAVILMVLLARRHGTIWHIYGTGIFGCSMVMMYMCSTVYHCSGIADLYITTRTLRDLDHCAIYFLIAGTYTPLTLINLIYNNTNNPAHLKSGKAQMEQAARQVFVGWLVLVIVWIMCIVGVSTKMAFGSENLHPVFTYGSPLMMGWMGIFVTGPLLRTLPKTGLRLLVIGGMSYTIGIVFMLCDALPFNHPVWHIFVGAGSIFHYFSIIACSIPIAEHSIWKKMENRTRSKDSVVDQFTRFAYANLSSHI
jgi:hemolysin III